MSNNPTLLLISASSLKYLSIIPIVALFLNPSSKSYPEKTNLNITFYPLKYSPWEGLAKWPDFGNDPGCIHSF
jgi:hypothetical protein